MQLSMVGFVEGIEKVVLSGCYKSSQFWLLEFGDGFDYDG